MFLSHLTTVLFVLFITLVSTHDQIGGNCTEKHKGVRKEWAALSRSERRQYIEAVLCLAESPPRLDQVKYPGIRNRWDDFTAVHINYTVSSHQDGNFLAWHRNFVYLWETALREECEYRGYQPYWDWPSNYLDLAGSPHFDGSDTSLSGDGAADDNYKLDFDFPKGTGGGCVLSGPFKNITVSMGPFPGLRNDRLPANAFAYQPSCLKRDLNSPLSGLCNGPDVTAALLNAENITEFQEIMHNGVGVNALLGPHGCGHLSIGPMMTDLWSSTSDPAFMLHHANVDRLWALWQEKDLRTRRFALNGTIMISDPPGAPKTTLQTVLGWGGLDRPRKVREVMDPKKYCYRYE